MKVVYCGGCNPHIDRAAVAAGLPVDDPDVRPGATVHLSGCPRACASGHQLVAEGGGQAGAGADGAPAGPDGPPVVVVAGELVDGVPTPSRAARPHRDAQAQGVKGMDWKTDYAGKRTTAAEALDVRQVRRPGRVRPRLRRAARPRRRARGAGRRARARRDQPHGRHGQGRVLQARVRRRLLPQVAVRRRHVPRRPSRTAAATTSRSSSTRSPSCSARATCTPDVVLVQVSPPDKHGFCSFGISVDYTKPAAQVGEDGHRPGQPQDAAHPRRRVHPRLARSTPSSRASRTSSSCSRRGSAPSRRPSASTSPASSRTGSCLQLGIGGIPDAVLLFLHEKNDLGIHSEMFSEGVVDLYNEGVITNRARPSTTTRWRRPSSWARAACTTSSTTTRP